MHKLSIIPTYILTIDLKKTPLEMYTVNHKKGGSTFVIITLKNLDGF